MKFRTVSERPELRHPDDDELQRLREARISHARKSQYWTEIDEVDLVQRGRLLVSATTDELYRRYQGAVYARGEVKSSFAGLTELHFYVRDGDIVFVERVPGSWSEIVERRERRRAQRARA